MKFHRLAFEGLLSYRKKTELPLADQGLVFIKGENRVSAAMTSNGAGKSAILDVLSWVLYGRTLKGREADEVICRFFSGTSWAELDFGTEREAYRLRRSRRPARVTLSTGRHTWEGREADEVLPGVLGYGFQTFANGVVFGRGPFEKFAQASQKDQLRILDEIQGLDLQGALIRAKAWRDEWKTKLDALEGDQGELMALRAQAQGQISEMEKALALFAQGKQERLRQAQELLDESMAEEIRAMENVKEVKAKAKRAQELRKQWDEIQRLQADLDAKTKIVEQLQFTRGRIQDEQATIETRLKTLLAKGKCPTCRTKFAGKNIADVTEAFKPDYVAAGEKVQQAQKDVEKAETNRQKANQALEQYLKSSWILKQSGGIDARVVAQAEAEGGDRALASAEQSLGLARGQEQRARTAFQNEKQRTWEGQPVLDKARKQVEEADQALRLNAQQQEKAKRTTQAAEYWVEAFGDRGIRNLLLDSVADFLNERLIYHLNLLTMGEAQVEISPFTALKTGSLKEKLSILATWNWGANSYADGSTGQDQRVDLALFAALQDVAEHRSARPFALRAWDEPGDGLDTLGQEVFCRWVESEARKRGTGLLISHSETLESLVQPDQIWTAVLDEGGSHIERE